MKIEPTTMMCNINDFSTFSQWTINSHFLNVEHCMGCCINSEDEYAGIVGGEGFENYLARLSIAKVRWDASFVW